MLGLIDRKPRRDHATSVMLLSLALLAVECSTAAALSESDLPSLRARADFSSVSDAKRPQMIAAAPADVNCPSVEIRQGASTLTVGPTGENATMSLRYQGTFVRVARDCSVADGNMVMKVGIQGRVIVGPAGGPGQVELPLRIAVVDEDPGGSKTITTKLVRIPVTVTDSEGALFTHVEDAMAFPLPTPITELDNYVVYIGFDPVAGQAQDRHKTPKPEHKHRRRRGGAG
jgi:hypothetical protein